MIKGNDMITFADIINFKYNANDVDADIRYLLKTGEFKPKYADMVRRFMLAEITNCKHTVEDKDNHMTIFLQGTMSEDNLTKTHEEITPILDRLGFEPKTREFWYNYFVHPTHGQQKSPPITALRNGNKSESMSPFGLVTDPFYTVYTEIHELMHAVQGKYNVVESEQEYLDEHYQLLYQGKSRDEAKAIQYAKNPKLEQIRYNNRAFNEMQANSAATCYMMLSAMRTGDKKIIDYVEQRLLNESASMSGALMYDHLGLAYFEYPATKQIIADIKADKCEHLMNDKGLLNWPELYKYTKEKVLGMGYSNDDMFMSLTTAKMLKELRDKNPGDKSKFLDVVEQTAPTLPAIFSLVASACKSTKMISASISDKISSIFLNGDSLTLTMKTSPIKLTKAILLPLYSKIRYPFPYSSGNILAGRTILSISSMISSKFFLEKVWFPIVIISTCELIN